MFASFFRTAVDRDESTGEYVYAHALLWALVDPLGRGYTAESLVDRDAPSIGIAQLDRGAAHDDPLLRRTCASARSRQGPRIVSESACQVSHERLASTTAGAIQRLDGESPAAPRRCPAEWLRVDDPLEQPGGRHGADGLVQGKSGEDNVYSVPRAARRGERSRWTAGPSALFAAPPGTTTSSAGRQFIGSRGDEPRGVAWDWIGAQLDNGWDLSVYCMEDAMRGESLGRFAILVDPHGQPYRFDAFTFEGPRRGPAARPSAATRRSGT